MARVTLNTETVLGLYRLTGVDCSAKKDEKALMETVMPDWTALVNLGGIGLVLAWFMLKSEPRMKAIEDAVDRNTKSNIMLIYGINRLSPREKLELQALEQELEHAKREREKK